MEEAIRVKESADTTEEGADSDGYGDPGGPGERRRGTLHQRAVFPAGDHPGDLQLARSISRSFPPLMIHGGTGSQFPGKIKEVMEVKFRDFGCLII